eukprot:5353861-Amphidinium_carterae.1
MFSPLAAPLGVNMCEGVHPKLLNPRQLDAAWTRANTSMNNIKEQLIFHRVSFLLTLLLQTLHFFRISEAAFAVRGVWNHCAETVLSIALRTIKCGREKGCA